MYLLHALDPAAHTRFCSSPYPVQTYVYVLASERETGQLQLMRQQGLQLAPYYAATYVWAMSMYVVFMLVFVGFGAAIQLNIFVQTAASVQVSSPPTCPGGAGGATDSRITRLEWMYGNQRRPHSLIQLPALRLSWFLLPGSHTDHLLPHLGPPHVLVCLLDGRVLARHHPCGAGGNSHRHLHRTGGKSGGGAGGWASGVGWEMGRAPLIGQLDGEILSHVVGHTCIPNPLTV